MASINNYFNKIKINLKLFFSKLMIKENKPVNSNELFVNGKIFDAKEKELDSIILKLGNNQSLNQGDGYRNIIQAITILGIKSDRYTKTVQSFNIILSLAVFLLTVFSVYLAYQQTSLAKKQTDFTEVSTRADRINQNKQVEDAKERCKQSPDLEDSGLVYINNGKPAPCSAVLNNKLL